MREVAGMKVLEGGALQFSFFNPNAAALSVLASEDVAAPLANWENLGLSESVGGGLHRFTDLNAGERQRRFYRLSAP